MTWPIADLDDVRRLRALRSALPGAMFAETCLASDFTHVWSVIDNVEDEFPGLVPDVRSIQIRSRDGDRISAYVRGRSGLRATFDMVLRPGWCLMQSRFLVFGMAAVPDGSATRFAYLAGLRFPGMRFLSPMLAPLQRVIARRVLRRFEERFAREA
jgi:hypothetical protein